MMVTNLLMRRLKNGAILALSNKKKNNPKIIFKKEPLNFFK